MENYAWLYETTRHWFDGKKSVVITLKLSREEQANGTTEYYGIPDYDDHGTAGRLCLQTYVSSLQENTPVRAWGWRIENRVDAHIELRDAEKITAQLRKIDRYLANREKKDGPADTFGAWALRVMQSLGVSVMVEKVPEADAQYPYRTTRAGDIAWRLNRDIAQIISESTDPAEKAA